MRKGLRPLPHFIEFESGRARGQSVPPAAPRGRRTRCPPRGCVRAVLVSRTRPLTLLPVKELARRPVFRDSVPAPSRDRARGFFSIRFPLPVLRRGSAFPRFLRRRERRRSAFLHSPRLLRSFRSAPRILIYKRFHCIMYTPSRLSYRCRTDSDTLKVYFSVW